VEAGIVALGSHIIGCLPHRDGIIVRQRGHEGEHRHIGVAFENHFFDEVLGVVASQPAAPLPALSEAPIERQQRRRGPAKAKQKAPSAHSGASRVLRDAYGGQPIRKRNRAGHRHGRALAIRRGIDFAWGVGSCFMLSSSCVVCYLCLMNVPFSYSWKAMRSSSWVFMTIGPYHATGSPMGCPDTRRKRTGFSWVVMTTWSPSS
jgi:hypothetical protein